MQHLYIHKYNIDFQLLYFLFLLLSVFYFLFAIFSCFNICTRHAFSLLLSLSHRFSHIYAEQQSLIVLCSLICEKLVNKERRFSTYTLSLTIASDYMGLEPPQTRLCSTFRYLLNISLFAQCLTIVGGKFSNMVYI